MEQSEQDSKKRQEETERRLKKERELQSFLLS
jgi:hypothetical protein